MISIAARVESDGAVQERDKYANHTGNPGCVCEKPWQTRLEGEEGSQKLNRPSQRCSTSTVRVRRMMPYSRKSSKPVTAKRSSSRPSFKKLFRRQKKKKKKKERTGAARRDTRGNKRHPPRHGRGLDLPYKSLSAKT